MEVSWGGAGDRDRTSKLPESRDTEGIDRSGRKLATARFDRQFVPEFVDALGRVYVSEYREIAGEEIPVVVRYTMDSLGD